VIRSRAADSAMKLSRWVAMASMWSRVSPNLYVRSSI
jgi:hypothetical protein